MHPIADGLLHKEACFLSLSHPQISKFKNCSCIGVLSLYFNSHPFLSYSKFIRIHTFPLIIQHSHGHHVQQVNHFSLDGPWLPVRTGPNIHEARGDSDPALPATGILLQHPLFDGPIDLAKQEMLQPRQSRQGHISNGARRPVVIQMEDRLMRPRNTVTN